MITKINDKITIWTKFNLAKLSMENISPPITTIHSKGFRGLKIKVAYKLILID